MKIEMSTDLLPIVNPGLYGTFIGSYYEDCLDEYANDFKNLVVEIGMNKINEVLNDIGLNAENGKLWSPRWYNYSNDQIHFNVVTNDNLLEIIKEETESEDFWEYVNDKEEWKSYDGYICCMPIEKEKFYKSLEVGNYNMERAVAMYINWRIECNFSDESLEEIQRDFENDIVEEVNCNTNWIEEEM